MMLGIPSGLLSFVVRAIPTVVALLASYMEFSDYFRKPFQILRGRVALDTYDFIVVGAGSAGSAVAARLAEDPTVFVLLLESGGDPNPVTLIPAATPYIMQPKITFGYATVSQNSSAFGMRDRSVLWPRGRASGGSSNINFMTYNRGNPNDYDQWATITGDIRWSFKNVLQYFLKLEDYYGFWDDGEGNDGFHNKGGPVRVESIRYTPGLSNILGAAIEMGFPIRDPNAIQTQGFSPIDFTQERGMRYSAHRAYIKPNERQPNLHVLRYSHVTQIHFDATLRAIGVSYIKHGMKYFVGAAKEIIVSCGTIASPQLLMLSGIGPKNHLRELGIPVLVNSPVGQNLHDHVATIIGPFLLNQPASYIPERDLTLREIMNYIRDGSGPLSLPYGVTTFGMPSTRFTTPDWPDILWTVHSLGVHQGLAASLDDAYNTKDQLFAKFLGPTTGRDAHFVTQVLSLPKSRGYLRLRDTNPQSYPLINPKYYTDPLGQDIETMVDGIEMFVKLYENSTSLGLELGARLSPFKVPGCEQFLHRSRSYWECVVRTVTGTLYHPAGTCAMGKPGHRGTVVDSQLRVVGTHGLRVADCSIMPKLPNTNTNAPAMMIGEMCADMVKDTWGLL